MDNVKCVIDACYSILKMQLSLCGYTVTLWNVLIFGFCVFLLFVFIFKSFR